MRHTAIGAGLAGLAVLALSAGANAQTTVRIPRIVNQKPTTTTTGNSAYSYVSTPTLRKQVLDSYLADVGRKNPARAQMLTGDFARTDADKFYQSLIKNTGLQNYDLADVMTAYQLTGWIIANKVKTMPPRSQILAARRQTAAALAKNPAASNIAERARMAEKFKLLTVTLHFGLLSAQKSGKTAEYADQIAYLFAETGPNPRTLMLTNAGFGRRG